MNSIQFNSRLADWILILFTNIKYGSMERLLMPAASLPQKTFGNGENQHRILVFLQAVVLILINLYTIGLVNLMDSIHPYLKPWLKKNPHSCYGLVITGTQEKWITIANGDFGTGHSMIEHCPYCKIF